VTPLEVLQAYVAGNGYEVIALNDGSRTAMPMKDEEAEAALAAVLNLIEAAQRVIAVADESDVMAVMLSEAVAVFVSGQEEPQ
jgi:hypothetical protein